MSAHNSPTFVITYQPNLPSPQGIIPAEAREGRKSVDHANEGGFQHAPMVADDKMFLMIKCPPGERELMKATRTGRFRTNSNGCAARMAAAFHDILET